MENYKNKEKEIYQILDKNFSPHFLKVKDVSYQHKNHSGFNAKETSHVEIEIKSDKLGKISRIEAHREINKALDGLWREGIHSIKINL